MIKLESKIHPSAVISESARIGENVTIGPYSVIGDEVEIGDGSIIGYIQPTDAVPTPAQSLQTKILLLFFYTVFHGIMMFLAGVPFFFYHLTGKTKEEMHEKVLAQRARMEQGAGTPGEGALTQEGAD